MEGLTRSYPRLFKRDEPEDDEGSEQDNRAGFVAHWGWYHTLDSLSNHDRTKWDYFLDMNVIAFLNYIAYEKDKQNHIAEQTRLAERNARR